MEEDLKQMMQPKTIKIIIFLKMEDDLNILAKGRRPQFFENGRQPQFFENGRRPKTK